MHLFLFQSPGNGKTLFMKSIAETLTDTTFFSLSASAFLSKWQGESEQLMRCLFKVALQQERSIIFIDEIDSLATSRDQNEGECSRRLKTELFIQMENALSTRRIIFVAATNRPFELDDAFLRRFDKLIFLPLPDKGSREQLLRQRFDVQEAERLSANDFIRLADITKGCVCINNGQM